MSLCCAGVVTKFILNYGGKEDGLSSFYTVLKAVFNKNVS